MFLIGTAHIKNSSNVHQQLKKYALYGNFTFVPKNPSLTYILCFVLKISFLLFCDCFFVFFKWNFELYIYIMLPYNMVILHQITRVSIMFNSDT